MSDPKDFIDTVEKAAGCRASFKEKVRIIESFEGETVWDGPVTIFSLYGHLSADTAYVLSISEQDYVILGLPPIEDPVDAVRAAIVSEHRNQGESA